MKRIFDLLVSLIGLLVLLPLFIGIALVISLDSRGGVFYRQKRVGLNGIAFNLLKFRTMKPGSDKKGLLTVGGKDNRVTRAGYMLRKYKLDELPQLLNVIAGDMSLVGPRPEVQKYVDLYTGEQRKVLSVKPGVTDYASIEYSDENEILAQSADPEQKYVAEILPAKIRLNMKYIENPGLRSDIKILWLTLKKILGKREIPGGN